MAESTALEALTAELLGDVGILHDKVKALNEVLPDVAEAIREAGREAAASITIAVDNATEDLKRAAREVSGEKVDEQVARIAEAVLTQVRREASGPAANSTKRKIILIATGMLVLGIIAGGIAGSAWQSKSHAMTEVQTQQLAAGKDFLQLLPQLDQSTRDRLIRMIQKNHE